jgi:hypothetical protein
MYDKKNMKNFSLYVSSILQCNNSNNIWNVSWTTMYSLSHTNDITNGYPNHWWYDRTHMMKNMQPEDVRFQGEYHILHLPIFHEWSSKKTLSITNKTFSSELSGSCSCNVPPYIQTWTVLNRQPPQAWGSTCDRCKKNGLRVSTILFSC